MTSLLVAFKDQVGWYKLGERNEITQQQQVVELNIKKSLYGNAAWVAMVTYDITYPFRLLAPSPPPHLHLVKPRTSTQSHLYNFPSLSCVLFLSSSPPLCLQRSTEHSDDSPTRYPFLNASFSVNAFLYLACFSYVLDFR